MTSRLDIDPYRSLRWILVSMVETPMASNKYQIVVQGEASETDSDDEVYITSIPSAQASAAGVKVPGEASETDSEGEVEKVRKMVYAGNAEYSHGLRKDLPPLIVIRNTPEFVSAVEEKPALKPEQSGRYNTLLQQKLQENNARLCNDVTQMFRQVYLNATKEIRMATTHLNNSQNGIINASHSIRLILEDLKSKRVLKEIHSPRAICRAFLISLSSPKAKDDPSSRFSRSSCWYFSGNTIGVVNSSPLPVVLYHLKNPAQTARPQVSQYHPSCKVLNRR
ncbi:hypothetical protein JZ751_021365 [Albula glossodonta]|uniref:Biogenesis of lysosome-related organelles complex 1 subunit 3 n=1 Tax=Albula glossodonta TaxID=121402 RepID=A0A8T2NIP2_9TELE|nr:hypothetical protein JZ751_021365 [Albula glossodonta]